MTDIKIQENSLEFKQYMEIRKKAKLAKSSKEAVKLFKSIPEIVEKRCNVLWNHLNRPE